MTALVESFTDAHAELVGTTQRVCVVDVAADGTSLVAHTSQYKQACPIWSPSSRALSCMYSDSSGERCEAAQADTTQRVCVVDVAADGTSLVAHTSQYKQACPSSHAVSCMYSGSSGERCEAAQADPKPGWPCCELAVNVASADRQVTLHPINPNSTLLTPGSLGGLLAASTTSSIACRPWCCMRDPEKSQQCPFQGSHVASCRCCCSPSQASWAPLWMSRSRKLHDGL